MTGVTILNEYACLGDLTFLIWVVVGIAILIASTIDLMNGKHFSSIVGILMTCVLIIISVVGYSLSKVTRFEALVDSSVPAIDLMERYKIIERKGDIWVLEPLADSKTKNDS